MSSPRISVIIPARNDPNRLTQCLDAVTKSTFTDYEVIVADDASTDDTASVSESKGAKVIRLPRQSGAAAARNAAAEVATGDILMFVDADVCVHPDTLAVAAASFDDPTVDAVFGSYDLEPGEKNLLSQYKNLAHRFYHQVSSEQTTSFWTGCGAIRRDVFNAFRFDAKRYARPSIEDIDLGARLTRAGKKLLINKRLQAKHLKHWSLLGIFRSDIFDRAIPWTRLILREKNLPGELNLSTGQRVAAVLSLFVAVIFLTACLFRPWLGLLPFTVYGGILLADRWTNRRTVSLKLRASVLIGVIAVTIALIFYAKWWAAAMLLPLGVVVGINAPFYKFFFNRRGVLFTLAVLPMQFAYYLYSVVAFVVGHLIHYIETMNEFRSRVRLYAALTAILYAMSWALVFTRAYVYHKTVDFAVSDATGYYIYLPSIVIDHDVQFENQLQDQFGDDKQNANDLTSNRWPTGVAMSILPAFLVAHGISLVIFHLTHWQAFIPNGYNSLYLSLCVVFVMSIGCLGMIVADKLLTERLELPGRITGLAIFTTWLGTNFFWYFVREPLLCHMVGAAWVIFSVYLIHRAERAALDGRLIWWQLPLLAFTASMAIACRMTNGFMFPMFVYLLIVLIQRGLFVRMLKLAPLILPALAPLVIQYAVMKSLGQTPSSGVKGLGYGPREQFYWTHPAILRTLLSSRHGWLSSTPTLFLAAWGLFWFFRKQGWRHDPLILTFVLSAMVLWYVNASWYAWWFGPSVGNRGFVELAGLYAIGFGLMYSWLQNKDRAAHRIVFAVLIVGFLVNYALMVGKMTHLIGENQTLISWEDRLLRGKWERI